MDATAATFSIIEFAYPLLIATAMAMSRALGVVVVTPAFTRLGLTGLLRSGVAIAISVPVVPGIMSAMAEHRDLTSIIMTGLMIKEFVIGIIIGIAFGIPFWAAEVAGDLVDLQRGSTSAQLVDPLAINEASISATLFSISLVALFFMSGGFLLLLDGFYRSYDLWPIASFTPVMGSEAVSALLGALDRIMQIALLLIAPVVLAILIADLMLAYLSRLSPQLHVFDLSLAIKNLLFCVLILLYAMFLVPLMLSQIGDMSGTFDMLRMTVSDVPAPNPGAED
ncbi:EscT/YscT/HrcT family type III secretion system export apparatus protein [Phyllobacterium salinisoli]|uniref:EscT/YscT/HrcT family type III secretion system export apparatus protein n=1 Tax=Phyllobacterium salinisoli TaxID=1899321 RepID=A0A368K2L0_9HYPH|nr:type III secretion system export apparatus subunit SctT [Phyllobacterium salinisoli]RCS22713.1 EscT/YscT/HrcT family type III secretion system export apparatus protein [Phyllobacterium salinisoli]